MAGKEATSATPTTPRRCCRAAASAVAAATAMIALFLLGSGAGYPYLLQYLPSVSPTAMQFAVQLADEMRTDRPHDSNPMEPLYPTSTRISVDRFEHGPAGWDSEVQQSRLNSWSSSTSSASSKPLSRARLADNSSSPSLRGSSPLTLFRDLAVPVLQGRRLWNRQQQQPPPAAAATSAATSGASTYDPASGASTYDAAAKSASEHIVAMDAGSANGQRTRARRNEPNITLNPHMMVFITFMHFIAICSAVAVMYAGPQQVQQYNHSNNSRPPPFKEGDDWNRWLKDMHLWMIVSTMSGPQQVASTIQGMTGQARQLAERLSQDEMLFGGIVRKTGRHADPLSYLIAHLEEHYATFAEEATMQAHNLVLDFTRKQGESLDSMLVRWRTARHRADHEGGFMRSMQG